MGRRGRKDAPGPGGKLSRVHGSSTPNGNLDILLTVLHASIGSLSLSIIISGAYPVLFAQVFYVMPICLERPRRENRPSFFGRRWPLSSPTIFYDSDVKASPVRMKSPWVLDARE